MNNDVKRGFTTAILHSDRDAVIEHGALHKPLHLSVAYGYRDANELAAVFQGRATGYAYGRQGNPTSAALEAKVTAMEGGVGTVAFATGMAAIGAIVMALLKAGDHIVSSQYVFGNTSSLLLTLEAHGQAVSFVDATDVAKVEAALTPATRIVFVETIANPRVQVGGPRAHRRAVPRARHPLRRRQHHDFAVAVPAEDGARGAHRQRARRSTSADTATLLAARDHRHGSLRLDALSEHRGDLQVASRRATGDCSSFARRGC